MPIIGHQGNVYDVQARRVASLPPVVLRILGRSWQMHDYLTPEDARRLASDLIAAADAVTPPTGAAE